MALVHFSKLFACEDAKLAKLLTDPSGGTETYGPLIDVPGIKQVTLSGTVESKELRGDNSLLDVFSVLKSLALGVTNAKISLDVEAVLLGGTVVDAGVTPNQTVTHDLSGSDTPNYFKFIARTPANGVDFVGGDAHLTLWKCVVSGLPDVGLAEEDYKIVGFNAATTPLLSTGRKWRRIVFNETAAAIA